MNQESLRERIGTALEAGDAQAAWTALVPRLDDAARDLDIAMLTLEVVHAIPDVPDGHALVMRLAEAHRADIDVLAMAARALVRIEELRPRDEPALKGKGPAEDAAALAFEAISRPDDNADRRAWLRSLRANALRLCTPDRDAEAVAAFESALKERREDGHLWFDFALLHKWRGRFQAAMDANLRAQARLGDTRPVLFNLGIAATAVGDGNVAGLCWKKLGFPASLNEKSGNAFVPDLRPVQVRVISRGAGYGIDPAVPDAAMAYERVWIQPLSPVHGVVATPTFRDAPIDYGDVVLWDAAPVSVETTADGPVPCFPLLEILRRGDEHRYRFVALEQRQGDVQALETTLPEGSRVFVQHERVEHVCSLCAAGDSMRKHEHLPAEEHRIVYGKLVTPGNVKPAEVLASLEPKLREKGRIQIAMPELYEKLGDTKRAGQEHQAFRGIERIAIKKGLVAGGVPS